MASAKIARAASSRTLAASATLLEERSNHDQNADDLRHRDRIRGARVRMERVPGRASLRPRAGDAAAAFALELPVRFSRRVAGTEVRGTDSRGSFPAGAG